jgi:mono/diheme cytochrome c family protein
MRRRMLVTMTCVALLSSALALSGLVGCGGKKEASSTGSAGTETTAGTPPAGGTETAAATGPGNATHGKELFDKNCQTCHGANGMGDGPLGASLNPKPRNFHDTAYMDSRPDDSLFTSVKFGKSQMPAWGAAGLSDQDIRDAIAYVRTFGKK